MSTLAKNTAFLTGASILQKVVAFVYFAVLARFLGVEDTGVYFLTLVVITSVAVFADLGVTSVLIRDVAANRDQASAILQKTLGVKWFAIFLAIVIAAAFPTVLGFDSSNIMLIWLAIPIMIADSLSLTFYGVLRGIEELRYESLGIFVGQTLSSVVGIVVIFSPMKSIALLIVALATGSIWNAIFSGVQVVRRLGVKSIVPSSKNIRPVLAAAFPFFLAAVFVKIYSYVDSFTLKAVIGDSAVGLYSVAYKLTYAFQFLPLAFIGALYPRMSSLANSPTDLKKTFLDAEWYLALLMAPIVFGIAALAPEIIGLVYGSDYAGSILPLHILIFVLIPIFFDFPIGSLLNATGQQMTKTKIMGVTMVVNFAANMFLIPRIGVPGASISAIISFLAMFGMGVWALRGKIHVTFREWMRTVGGFILAGLAMMVVVLVLKSMMPWIATIPIGAIVFIGLSIVTKAFTKSHWAHAKALILRKTYGAIPASNA
ncbi:MAG: flippase [Patescibacteria group bacterium]